MLPAAIALCFFHDATIRSLVSARPSNASKGSLARLTLSSAYDNAATATCPAGAESPSTGRSGAIGPSSGSTMSTEPKATAVETADAASAGRA